MAADVVLVDAKLAEGEPSGYEVCRALKEDPATAHTPVVLLVSNQEGVDEAKLREAGGDGYIAKPFDTQELIDKVGEVMGKPVARATPSAATAVRPSVAPVTATRPVESVSTASSSSAAAFSSSTPPKSAPSRTTGTFTPPPAASASGSASRSSPSWAAPTPSRGSDSGRDGEIPVVVPIPFTSAAAPTAGMLRRLQEAAPGDPLDPAVVQALLSLSRDVIERVVWEVVPDLAEEIIRKQAAKHLQSA